MTIPVLKGLHVTRLPSARQEILNGTFQRFQCTECDEHFLFEGTTVYTDFDRMDYVAVEPPPARNWRAVREKHQQAYDRNVELGPPVARELASGFRTRLVFGLGALREKLIVWDANLDDRLLELCKAGWFEREGKDPTKSILRLDSVLPGQHLILVHLKPSTEPRLDSCGYVLPTLLERVVIRAAEWQKVQRRQARLTDSVPWLKEAWLVDLFDAHPASNGRGF
jgi:hypothetical protein